MQTLAPFHSDQVSAASGVGASWLTATVTATAANYGELWRTLADERAMTHIQGERWRTVANAGERKNTVKTTKVQAFGGSNPSPSVFRFGLPEHLSHET
jgi:hypothetical protein